MDLTIIYIFCVLVLFKLCSTNQDIITDTKTGNILINCNNISSSKTDILVNNYFIKIWNCPFPKNDYYNIYFTKLNIESINTLIIQNITSRNNTLTNTVFQNLNHIKILKIDNANIIDIYSDLFKNLDNIQTLTITNNNITNIKKDTFLHSNISILTLTSNNIKYIEDESFINLNNLKELSLNDNNLKLFHDTFKGLTNLKILNLTNCHIKSVNFLYHLYNLKIINLSKNNLNDLSEIDFQNNLNLENLILSNNKNLLLEENAFKNLKNLSVIRLDGNNFSTIPKSINSLSELKELYLQNNKIKEIHKTCFAATSNLRILNLENNLIKILDEFSFTSLAQLEILNLKLNKLEFLHDETFLFLKMIENINLEDNFLVTINEKIFRNLTFLNKLNLKGNKIRTVHENAFSEPMILHEIILSNNYLNFEKLSLGGIRKLDLSYNLFKVFPVILSTGFNLMVNISNNQISNIGNYLIEAMQHYIIDFSNNNFAYLNFKEYIKGIYGTVTIIITNNPIICDCYNFDSLKFLKYNVSMKKFQVKFEELKCYGPEKLKNIDVINVKLDELMCNLNNLSSSFSDICDWNWRPLDNNVIIDCSNRSLKNIPKLNITKHITLGNQLINISSYEIYLNYNLLEIMSPIIYENTYISKLDFSHNGIKYIRWIPPKIKELRLDNNKLQVLDGEIFELLERTQSFDLLTLDHNPWICNCDTTKLQNFLINLREKINVTDVRCNINGDTVSTIKWLCFSRDIIYISVGVSFGLIILIISLLSVFYFRYRLEVNVWLYAHNLCSWFLTEDKLDKDKKFDIFLSFSHKDIEYVTNTLLPILEDRNYPFSVCLHDRNFIPGCEISSNIINSVLNSRRTLIVLSNNFLESYWGKLEFRTAHNEAIREGRARVILIIYGDLLEDKLDEELRAYFKTNTYIKWDDPLFEDRLKNALPHRRHLQIYRFSDLVTNSSNSDSF